MNILDIVIILFVILESLNVIILYFIPDFKFGNGVSIFEQWHKSKENELEHMFAKYMANWVAGTKTMFILLLLVIVFVGNDFIKFVAIISLILSTSTYYFKLHPIIKLMDKKQMIIPPGYSKVLLMMITGFIFMFVVALGVYTII